MLAISRQSKKKPQPLKVNDLKKILKEVKGNPVVRMYSDSEGNQEMSLYEVLLDNKIPTLILVPA